MAHWIRAHPGTGGTAVAVVALLVSFLSYKTANDTLDEAREVTLDVVATTNLRYSTLRGHGVNVAISNESLRGVIVTRAEVQVDGEAVGEADGYIDDPRVLEQHAFAPDRLALETRPLPLTVSPRSVANVSLFVAFSEGAGLRTAERFCESVLLGLLKPPPKEAAELSLTLHYLPEGKVTIPLETAGAMDERFEWQMALFGPLSSPTSLSVRRKLTEPGAAREITLKLTSAGIGVAYELTRPIIGAEPTRFPLPTLSPGKYSFVLLDQSAVVSGGRFELPLRNERERSIYTRPSLLDPFCRRYIEKHPPS